MSNLDRNLRRILTVLNSIQYYTCAGERPGTSFLAVTIEIRPHEVSTLKYLIRKEMLGKKQENLLQNAMFMRSQEDSLRDLLRSLREARVKGDQLNRTDRPVQVVKGAIEMRP